MHCVRSPIVFIESALLDNADILVSTIRPRDVSEPDLLIEQIEGSPSEFTSDNERLVFVFVFVFFLPFFLSEILSGL